MVFRTFFVGGERHKAIDGGDGRKGGRTRQVEKRSAFINHSECNPGGGYFNIITSFPQQDNGELRTLFHGQSVLLLRLLYPKSGDFFFSFPFSFSYGRPASLYPYYYYYTHETLTKTNKLKKKKKCTKTIIRPTDGLDGGEGR